MTTKVPVVYLDIDDIKPYELNAKVHDNKQIEKIAKSISEFGWDQPIVVDKDHVVIKGHGRRLAAIHLGITNVPVWVRDDLTEEQVRASRLADNRVAVGDIDADILQQELSTLDFDMNGIFDKKEIDFVFADLGEFDLDAIVMDIGAEAEKHSAETSEMIAETDNAVVRIDKVLGFKEIAVKDERAIRRFLAVAEAETGAEGAQAFVSYVKQLMETA
ncbi:ParB/Srx family N-terminal domain-containing protein [Acinetobacter tibetensis]|uniref:ParB/Srx family N-terminal domain-containing protein n=1 Tax=Acinetobacter tibetensis TaxID=2943497 RepID=UPI003A4DE174